VTYSLPAARSVDWTEAGYPSGIPAVTTVGANVRGFGATGNGTSDDTDAFERAIGLSGVWDAANPKLLYIPSGTYKITRQLYPVSGIVFSGDGSNTTNLKYYLGTTEISKHCFHTVGSKGSYVSITSGATKGSDTIVLSSASGFSVGDVIDIKQTNSNDWWTSDVRDYVKVGDAGTVGAYGGSSAQGDWAVDCRGEMAIISGKDGNTLTLDHALYTTLDPSYSPVCAKVTAKTNIGFQYFKIERGDAPADEGPANWGANFYTQYANKVWWRGVESYMPSEHHWMLVYGYQCECRQCWWHDAWHYDNTGEAYGWDFRHHCTACKVEDNCADQIAMALAPSLGTCGCVLAYNYITNHKTAPVDNSDSWITDVECHGYQAHHNLIEGNVVNRLSVAEYWGPCPQQVIHRNRVKNSIEIYDKSNDCTVTGNEVYGTAPKTYQKSNVTGTLWHGNEVGSQVQWDANTADHVLPNSFVYTSKPSWWIDECAWPPIGPDATYEMIPAQYRYENCSKCPQA
jgi:hypothetical protein